MSDYFIESLIRLYDDPAGYQAAESQQKLRTRTFLETNHLFRISKLIDAKVQDYVLQFETSPSLFSPTRLDNGTLAMLSIVRFVSDDKVLDLGCGYGTVGVFAAKQVRPEAVWMVDNDPEAVALATRNAMLNNVDGVHVLLSDGFAQIQETGFTKILCNPPYHVDFSVPRRFIEKGFNRLAPRGEMWMVTRRVDWYRNKISAIFGGVRLHNAGGYTVFEAIKQSPNYARRL
jgi:16S rRNA (guanine1207-N2)-methyltransferase